MRLPGVRLAGRDGAGRAQLQARISVSHWRSPKARSSSTRPRRTSQASLTRPPDHGRAGKRHACGRQPVPRPEHPRAGSLVLRGTMAVAAPVIPSSPAELHHAAQRDALPAQPKARPIDRRRLRSARPSAVAAELRQVPSDTLPRIPKRASTALSHQLSESGGWRDQPESWDDSWSRLSSAAVSRALSIRRCITHWPDAAPPPTLTRVISSACAGKASTGSAAT
jgi:hypothetical protein